MKVCVFGHSYVRDIATLGNNSVKIGNTNLDITYLPFPGATFSTFLNHKHLLRNLVNLDPEIVLVILGGNDIFNNIDTANLHKLCRLFYNLLRSLLPSSKIIASHLEF